MVKSEWTPGCLGDVIESLDAGVSVNSGTSSSSNQYVLKTSAVAKGKLSISEKKPVLPSECCRLKCCLRKDSILFSRMNTPELVGECAYVPQDHSNIFLPDRIWQAQFKPDAHLNAKWLNYVLCSPRYKSLITSCATGTSSSMKNISKEQLLSIAIDYPTYDEQTVIANALSDIDNLISNLEKLIAKKEAIKQGAMQELLTGRQRLPGFSQKWKEYTVGDISDYSTETIAVDAFDSRYYVSTDNMLQNCEGIKYYTTQLTHGIVRKYIPGDILLSNIRPYLRKIWLSDSIGGCSNDVLVIRIEDKSIVSPLFLYHLLSMKSFFDYIMASAGGTKMPRGDKKIIKSYPLNIPTDIYEQAAIVTVLSDMSSEISALEKKLNKAIGIKLGMMSELLTGRIRLV